MIKDLMKLLASIFLLLSMVTAIIKNIVLSEWLFEEKDINFTLSMFVTMIYSLGWRSLVIIVLWIY